MYRKMERSVLQVMPFNPEAGSGRATDDYMSLDFSTVRVASTCRTTAKRWVIPIIGVK